MFIFAYLLFSNIAFIAGMLLVLVSQSKRDHEEPLDTRSRHLTSTLIYRGRRTQQAAQRR